MLGARAPPVSAGPRSQRDPAARSGPGIRTLERATAHDPSDTLRPIARRRARIGDAATWEPQAADSRLAQTAGADPAGVFTSDLSVSEYVLLGEAGFEPLGFVVGSSIYHVGLQVGRWSQNQELQVLTQAMYNARELAMARMQAEADHLSADGIVGVQLRLQMYAWGQSVLEFVATGTAVRHLTGDGRPPCPRRPRVHLGPVRAGLLPADRGRRRAGRVRARHVRVPHRAPVGHAGAAAGRPEPGDDPVHPGRLRGARAGPDPDAGRGDAGPVVRASSGSTSPSPTTSGASTPPSSWPPARPSAAWPTSTGCRKPRPSPPSPWAWTADHPHMSGQECTGSLVCMRSM